MRPSACWRPWRGAIRAEPRSRASAIAGRLGDVIDYSRPVAASRADALADLVLLDHEGRDVRLGDLWSERPVALVWLRHYG